MGPLASSPSCEDPHSPLEAPWPGLGCSVQQGAMATKATPASQGDAAQGFASKGIRGAARGPGKQG